MAAEQRRVGFPGNESVSGLQLADVPLITGTGTTLCDVSIPFYRLFMPTLMRRACNRVRKPLEPPYEGPFRVPSRNAKTCQILRGDKEDVVSVDRVKAAVAEKPPNLRQ
ncbi:unnamed protein product [Schistocephalus solidus]|uniref:Uncharacterized protein n=1 Tax=Schistocephalus solidus TaxID=70667 RepID=A0A183TBN9_SCHSO|nr:unnamed protein product [Schistocephalus solidus]